MRNKILKEYHEAMEWWHSLTPEEQNREKEKSFEEDRREHPGDYIMKERL
jgi:hypothetical protein